MKKLLIIKDNEYINEVTVRYLEKAGFQVVTATTLIEIEHIIQEALPAFILFDIYFLERNSFDFVRKMCNQPEKIISFITIKHHLERMLNGVGVDGDDFITASFYPMELAQLTTAGYSDRNVIEIDNLRIDIDQKEVYKDGQMIKLYTKEKKLLFYLVKNANKVISSQQIIQDIWGRHDKTNDKTVVVHISTLRRKLGDSYSKGNGIQTVRGFGYKFVIH